VTGPSGKLSVSRLYYDRGFAQARTSGRERSQDRSAKNHDAIRQAKREILKVFGGGQGNHAEAAKHLGVHPNNLHRLIRSLDLKAADREELREKSEEQSAKGRCAERLLLALSLNGGASGAI